MSASAVNSKGWTFFRQQSECKTILGGLVLLLTMLMHGNAQALLVSMDSSFGSGTVTQDTDTGLEWLDPALALGAGSCCFSYNDVLSQMTSGGLYEGFRFATASELETLFFVSAGIEPGTAGADGAIAALIGLVGDTFSETFGPDFGFFATSAYFDVGIPGQAGLASLEIESFFGEWGGGNAFIGLSPDSLDVNGGPFGSWLVREMVSATPVSEPGVFLLLVAAIGMAGIRYRGKSVPN